MSLEADPAREEEELRAYLGAAFDYGSLTRWQDALERELAACGDEAAFYRGSNAYLYNLTAFAMSATKLPYLRELARLVEPGARLLDYGCGIGSDGLALLEAGYRVEFADFDNPSTRYLRWRLDRRGLEAPIYDLDDCVPGGFDAAFAFDVIEHVDDPVAFLERLEDRAEIVLVNLLEPGHGEESLHRELPVRELLRRAARRRILSYEVYHGRSHLLAYRARRASPIWWARARLRLRAGHRKRSR